MKKISPYFNFKDQRGSINGILNFGNWQEINHVFSKKNTVRADHYHKETEEIFIIIEGNIQVTYFPVNNPELKKTKTVKKGDVFLFETYIYHKFEVIEDSVWYNVLSKKINADNPDIHTLNSL